MLNASKTQALAAGELILAHYAYKDAKHGTQNNTVDHPNHWALIRMTSTSQGYAHQIQYSTAPGVDFWYDDGYSDQKLSSPKKSSAMQGLIIIGKVDAAHVATFHKILHDEPVVNDNKKPPEWNCQTWILNVLPKLQTAGIVRADVTGTKVKEAFGAP